MPRTGRQHFLLFFNGLRNSTADALPEEIMGTLNEERRLSRSLCALVVIRIAFER